MDNYPTLSISTSLAFILPLPCDAGGMLPSCHPVWDSANARLSSCAVPYFSSIPAIVILGIIISHVSSSPFAKWRPEWTKPFVLEKPPECLEDSPERGKQRVGWVLTLFTLSFVGFAAGFVQLVPPIHDMVAVISPASWAAATLLIAITRPKSCPTSLLAFFLSSLAVELSLVVNNDPSSTIKTAAHYITMGAATSACIAILFMPLRSSSLPSFDIGAVGQEPSSDFRSPEDNLRLWQFLTVSWMAPLLSKGKKRQLNEDDVWLLGFEFKHRKLHERFRLIRGSVIGRLLQANGIDVFIVTIIATVQMLCGFSTPVLLQQLLQSMSDPGAPKRVPLTYALLSLVLRFVGAQTQVLNLWYGRRCYERCRGEMITMIYEKALSRKNTFGEKPDAKQECPEAQTDELENGAVGQHIDAPVSKRSRICGFIPWRRNARRNELKESASIGKIFNLIRGDAYEVAQRFWEVDSLVDKPLGLIIAMVLVWKLIGSSCLLGIMAIVLAQAINAIIIRILLRAERVRRLATDARLQVSSEFVEAIRHLRWYGWQSHWLRHVMSARQSELNLRIITSLWNVLIGFVNAFASGLFPVVALYAYTLLAGNPLRIDIIFPALQLFTMLETRLRDIPALITVLINASVALERIEAFMAEPNKDASAIEFSTVSPPIQLESSSFAWPGRLSPVLSGVTVTIPTGLTVLCGKVGAGKTALLQALLGELDWLGGDSHIPNEMIGYCSQTPWLQSMSIRDNILFYSPYDEQRYKRTLDACELIPDLANFKHGDLSFVGENGIGLSGGQKARVALARAVYSSARILLLDDPLSALDYNTAENIVQKCFSGSLMQDRIVVLATHRTMLVHHIAVQLIEVHNGQVTVHSKDRISSVAESSEREHSQKRKLGEAESQNQTNLNGEAAAVPDKFIEEEHRAQWGVQAKIYWRYIRAGTYKWWTALVLVLAIYRLASVGESWFLKEWGESYKTKFVIFDSFGSFSSKGLASTSLPKLSSIDTYFKWTDPFVKLPLPFENVRPWLLIFFLIATFQSVALLIGQCLMLVIVYCASKTLFQQVMRRVSHATFRFFDVTPMGRLMNRLTSDFGVVDGNISAQFQGIAWSAITWISSILVIATATPTFLGFSLVLTVVFVITFLRFLPTSQSLRRLEMVSLSPLLSNFGELLHGLTTVRAFHAEGRFQDRVIAVLDNCQGMDHFYWSLQAWLVYRFESLSALSTFGLTVLALYTNVSPGLAAFVLIAANNFVDSTHALCRQYGQLQMDFVSVERVDELLHIEQEAPGTVDPPASWPTFGSDITFEDVTIRYRPHMDPALSKISLRIPGGSTTAVLGRTGSGKSTLATALLSVTRPESGRILIDKIDIAEVDTQAFRTRITFVAQDPVLFPGSIRLNLDPTGEYSDGECADVLYRVCSRHGWSLDTHIEAGGRNLSQGQRQLIGLTRAVLRRSPIVILDEATASIDHETSLEIQQILREEMQESTVITIAHRLEAIKDADYYIVLDHGSVSEQGYVQDRHV